ncbi:MAG: putative nitrogen fixation protein NifT [Candidatus Competibacteraceae bacterium]|nr:putative nitrogen fixation protein NifT [Candidatus Competibacteraceae bacterium]
MPIVMLRNNNAGELVFYLAKKDQEEKVVDLEYPGPSTWGGTVKLADGSSFYLEPLATPPKLPITLRARRV